MSSDARTHSQSTMAERLNMTVLTEFDVPPVSSWCEYLLVGNGSLEP